MLRRLSSGLPSKGKSPTKFVTGKSNPRFFLPSDDGETDEDEIPSHFTRSDPVVAKPHPYSGPPSPITPSAPTQQYAHNHKRYKPRILQSLTTDHDLHQLLEANFAYAITQASHFRGSVEFTSVGENASKHLNNKHKAHARSTRLRRPTPVSTYGRSEKNSSNCSSFLAMMGNGSGNCARAAIKFEDEEEVRRTKSLYQMMLNHYEDAVEDSEDEEETPNPIRKVTARPQIKKSEKVARDEQPAKRDVGVNNQRITSISTRHFVPSDQQKEGRRKVEEADMVGAALEQVNQSTIVISPRLDELVKNPMTVVDFAISSVTTAEDDSPPAFYEETYQSLSNLTQALKTEQRNQTSQEANESNITTPDEWEDSPATTEVVRGGFTTPVASVKPRVLSEPFKMFPPLSNLDYALTSDGHDPKFIHRAELTGSTFLARNVVQETLLQPQPQVRFDHKGQIVDVPALPVLAPLPPLPPALLLPIPPLVAIAPATVHLSNDGTHDGGHAHANTLAWTHSLPDQPSGDIEAPLDEELPADDERLMHCRKCNKKHIPPGSIIDLHIRDRCGAYLPDWFPAEQFLPHPWTALTKMNNDVYRYEKLERGDVWLRSESDLVHHDAHPKWSVIRHQKGGFWRCRSGLDATSVEQNCKKCFPDLNPHAPLPIQGEAMEHIAELKRRYERFMETYQNKQGQLDKQIALDLLRDMPSHSSLLPKTSHMTTQPHLTPHPTNHGLGVNLCTPSTASFSSSQALFMSDEHPISEEHQILNAMWNHVGPISDLKIGSPATEGWEGGEEQTDGSVSGSASPTRNRFHRQTSSLSTAIVNLLSPRPGSTRFRKGNGSVLSSFGGSPAES